MVAGAVAATALAFVLAMAAGATQSVWSQPQTPIGDVLNRVAAGQVRSAVITGDRVVLRDRTGPPSGPRRKAAPRSPAVQVLQEKRAILVRIAEHLQAVETMDGDQLDALLAPDAGSTPAPVNRWMPAEESGRGAQVAAAKAD